MTLSSLWHHGENRLYNLGWFSALKNVSNGGRNRVTSTMIAVFIQTGPWGRSHSVPVYKCLLRGFEEQGGGENLLDCLFKQKMTHQV